MRFPRKRARHRRCRPLFAVRAPSGSSSRRSPFYGVASLILFPVPVIAARARTSRRSAVAVATTSSARSPVSRLFGGTEVACTGLAAATPSEPASREPGRWLRQGAKASARVLRQAMGDASLRRAIILPVTARAFGLCAVRAICYGCLRAPHGLWGTRCAASRGG